MSDELILVAAGDVMLADSSHFLGRGVGASIARDGAGRLLDPVRGVIEGGDLFVFNLESPASTTPGGDAFERVYRAGEASLRDFRPDVATVACTANNHILDHGPHVLDETVALLERHGYHVAGFAPRPPYAPRDARLSCKGYDVVVCAESLVPAASRPGSDPRAAAADLVARVRASDAHLTVAAVHWGDEYVELPSPDQRALAHALVDAGAKVVLGHHPHVLQPVEERDGAVIAYSLGNFVFDHDWGDATTTAGLLEIVCGAAGVVSWRFHPTRRGRGHAPTPLDGVAADDVRAALAAGTPPDDEAYAVLAAARLRHMRVRMKIELMRHFHKTTRDTWNFLLGKRLRNRNRPKEDG